MRRFRRSRQVSKTALSLMGWGLLVLCLGAVSGLMAAPSAHATTGINKQINYQARLLNAAGATVPDGNYNIEFKIYQDGTGCVGSGSSPCGGTLKWTEDWLNNNSQGVTVTNGYFSVALGAGSDSAALGTAVDFNQSSLWLSVNIGNTNGTCATFSVCSGDGEMLPFTQFAAAPYAFNADKLGGLSSSSYAQLGASQTFTGASVLQPTTDITPAVIKQTSAGATTSDIFDVQTANGSYILRATATAANSSAVTLASVGGSNALTLTAAGALTLTGSGASTWDIGANTLSLQTTNNGAITTGTGVLTDKGTLVVQGTGNALTMSGVPSGSASQSLLSLGNAISGGSTAGTFIGVNAVSVFTGDLINLQNNNTSEFSVSGAGDVKQGNGVSTFNGAGTPNSYTTTATMTTADMLKNRIITTSQTAAFTLTTPTAAALIAAIPKAANGDVFSWLIVNGGTVGNVTLAGGTGVTFTTGSTTLPRNSPTYFSCQVTGVIAGTITCY